MATGLIVGTIFHPHARTFWSPAKVHLPVKSEMISINYCNERHLLSPATVNFKVEFVFMFNSNYGFILHHFQVNTVTTWRTCWQWRLTVTHRRCTSILLGRFMHMFQWHALRARCRRRVIQRRVAWMTSTCYWGLLILITGNHAGRMHNWRLVVSFGLNDKISLILNDVVHAVPRTQTTATRHQQPQNIINKKCDNCLLFKNFQEVHTYRSTIRGQVINDDSFHISENWPHQSLISSYQQIFYNYVTCPTPTIVTVELSCCSSKCNGY